MQIPFNVIHKKCIFWWRNNRKGKSLG